MQFKCSDLSRQMSTSSNTNGSHTTVIIWQLSTSNEELMCVAFNYDHFLIGTLLNYMYIMNDERYLFISYEYSVCS